MKNVLFILLLFTGFICAQQVQPLVADTNSSGVYDVNYIKILGTKNDATHHRLPVDGNITGTIPGVSTYAAQVLLLHIDSLIQTNTKKLADSTAILRQIVNKLISNPSNSAKQDSALAKLNLILAKLSSVPSTSVKQDSLLALLKLLGRTITSPYYMSGSPQDTPVRDSLSGATPKTVDLRYSNGKYPTKVNITFYSSTLDTIKLQTLNIAKNDSSYLNVGWKDRSSGNSGVGTPDVNESNNAQIIIPAGTSRTFESDGLGKVGLIRIQWYDTRGKSARKVYLSTQRLN